MSDDDDPRGRSVRAGPELADFWDKRYAAGGFMFGENPNVFLHENAPAPAPAPGARALVPGDGYGRNGLWLAEMGYRVLSVDISPLGVERARQRAAGRGVAFEAAAVDLTSWTPEPGAFDLVAVAFVHFPPGERVLAHARYVQALAPGGRLLLQAYTPDQVGRGTGGPKTPLLLFTPELLAADFADLEILLLREHLVDLDEGERHRGQSSVVELIATKPG